MRLPTFLIEEVEGLSFLCSENKVPDKLLRSFRSYVIGLDCFQLDLSSVSAFHSDEEGLILQHSARDVVSDEHMDLSKTRIDENLFLTRSDLNLALQLQ